MSKKAFNSDLDHVFSAEAQHEPNIDNSPWLLRTAPASSTQVAARTAAIATAPTTARRPTKSFCSDLDAFFAESSADRGRQPTPAEDPSLRLRERPRRSLLPLSGLDGLIRDTTGGKVLEQQAKREAEEQAGLAAKRVTFTYDRDRFAMLKDIARQEGSYLKDIISGLLNDYVAKYKVSNVRTSRA